MMESGVSEDRLGLLTLAMLAQVLNLQLGLSHLCVEACSPMPSSQLVDAFTPPCDVSNIECLLMLLLQTLTPMSNGELVYLVVAGPSPSPIKKTLVSTLWSFWPAGMGWWGSLLVNPEAPLLSLLRVSLLLTDILVPHSWEISMTHYFSPHQEKKPTYSLFLRKRGFLGSQNAPLYSRNHRLFTEGYSSLDDSKPIPDRYPLMQSLLPITIMQTRSYPHFCPIQIRNCENPPLVLNFRLLKSFGFHGYANSPQKTPYFHVFTTLIPTQIPRD